MISKFDKIINSMKVIVYQYLYLLIPDKHAL